MTVQRLTTGRVKLLLVGAGHAHLEIMRRLAIDPPGVELTVVSPGPRQQYSGMVPGYIQGTYSEEEISLESIVQKRSDAAAAKDPHGQSGAPVSLVLVTYAATEAAIRSALDKIAADGLVAEPPQVIRIERE